MASFYEKTLTGIILKIKLNPKAKQNSIGEVFWADDETSCLKINVTAPPEDNKANKALINLLSSTMKIAKSHFEIISGKTSRNKKILINGDGDLLENKIKAFELLKWV